MRSQRRAVWVGCAAIALALAGCGSITPLESADGGTVSPPRLTRSDAGRISIETADAGPSTVETNDADPLPPPTKDAGAPMAEPKDAGNGPSPARDAGAPMPDTKDAGKGANNSSCGAKGNCSNGLVCNPASGLCVECLVNDDCGGKTKLCDLATLTCVITAAMGIGAILVIAFDHGIGWDRHRRDVALSRIVVDDDVHFGSGVPINDVERDAIQGATAVGGIIRAPVGVQCDRSADVRDDGRRVGSHWRVADILIPGVVQRENLLAQ